LRKKSGFSRVSSLRSPWNQLTTKWIVFVTDGKLHLRFNNLLLTNAHSLVQCFLNFSVIN
jgi:hypothetical protein